MNKLLVALFVFVISLPLAATLAGVDGADPSEENRELATLPRLDGSWQSIVDAGSGFSSWFEDHFAFRSTLVRWSAELRLFGLGVSPTPSVVRGRDGWFFYGEDGSIEDYAQVDPLTPEALANWRAALVAARDWLRRRHVAYVFTIAPDKYVIYPEMMPSTLVRTGSVSRTEQLYQALSGSGLEAVDVRPGLLSAKRDDRIFQKTDTHWNERGVLVAYQAIIDAVRRSVPQTPPAWAREDFEPIARETEGLDLARMMGLKRVLGEIDLALVPKRHRQARVVEPAGADPTDELGRLVTEIPGSSLPRAVIFRDSFVSQLVPFLSEHFSRAVYVWQNDFDAALVEQEHPDVVIQEIVGRHLYGFIPSPELVPKE
jgi:alginate O-acetyltransferase complex protein AlgJ